MHYVGDFSQTPRSANKMMELSQTRIVVPRVPAAPTSQQSRLVIALVLLLLALAAVLIKDRQFWFGSEQTIVDANDYQPTVTPQIPAQAATPAPQTLPPIQPVTKSAAAPAAPAPAHAAKKQAPSTTTATQPKAAEAPVVVANRTVLPPLAVEVVAGNAHHKARPGNNSTKVEIPKPVAPVVRAAAPVATPAIQAAERERLAEAVQPSYPALAQHMNVEGSVVLQALIAADGTVQNLHVVSGPQILATAAQEAVRRWKFKAVYQNGEAVETRATITVNFSIKVNDTTSNTNLAESQPTDQLSITQ